jgi:hypothetical protein
MAAWMLAGKIRMKKAISNHQFKRKVRQEGAKEGKFHHCPKHHWHILE